MKVLLKMLLYFYVIVLSLEIEISLDLETSRKGFGVVFNVHVHVVLTLHAGWVSRYFNFFIFENVRRFQHCFVFESVHRLSKFLDQYFLTFKWHSVFWMFFFISRKYEFATPFLSKGSTISQNVRDVVQILFIFFTVSRVITVRSEYGVMSSIVDIGTESPAGKIAEKAVWRSVFLTIKHCILNADSTKTHSSSVTF